MKKHRQRTWKEFLDREAYWVQSVFFWKTAKAFHTDMRKAMESISTSESFAEGGMVNCRGL